MASYVVTSDRLSGHPRGSRLSDEDLAGVDVEALVDGGHLAADVQATPDDRKTDPVDLSSPSDPSDPSDPSHQADPAADTKEQ